MELCCFYHGVLIWTNYLCWVGKMFCSDLKYFQNPSNIWKCLKSLGNLWTFFPMFSKPNKSVEIFFDLLKTSESWSLEISFSFTESIIDVHCKNSETKKNLSPPPPTGHHHHHQHPHHHHNFHSPPLPSAWSRSTLGEVQQMWSREMVTLKGFTIDDYLIIFAW